MALAALILSIIGLLGFPFSLLVVLPGLAFVSAWLTATFAPAAGIGLSPEDWRTAPLYVPLVLSPAVLPTLAIVLGRRARHGGRTASRWLATAAIALAALTLLAFVAGLAYVGFGTWGRIHAPPPVGPAPIPAVPAVPAR